MHNLAEVEELCERVAIISRGQIRAIDTPQNLRRLNRQTERVHLTVRDITIDEARRALADENLHETELIAQNQTVTISFVRERDDKQLDQMLRIIHAAGGSVSDCESEQGTLLDVLESYEREADDERIKEI